MRNVNKLVPSISPYNESKVLTAVAAANRALAGIANPKQQNNDDTAGPDNETPEIIQRNQAKQNQATHELRKRRSSISITLDVLSDRLRAVESEIGIGRSSEEHHHRSRERCEPQRREIKGQESGSKALEKQKAEPASAFGVFWEGLKQTFGFGNASSTSSTSSSGSSSSTSASGKANKVLVAVIVVAVLGSTAAAKFRRR